MRTRVRHYQFHRGPNGSSSPGVWLRRGDHSVFIEDADLIELSNTLVDIHEAIEKGEDPNATVLHLPHTRKENNA